jgi:hypothetical protein
MAALQPGNGKDFVVIITTSMSVLVASLIASGAIPEQPNAPRAVAHITAPGQDGTVRDPRGNVEPAYLGVAPVPGYDPDNVPERTPAHTGEFA